MEEMILILAKLEENERKLARRHCLRSLRDSSNPFSMPDEVFRNNFQMSKSLFASIIDDIMPFDTQKTSLPFLTRLKGFFFFGHGSYQKCIGNHWVLPMSQPSVSRSLHEMANLLISKKGSEIKFPVTIEEKAIIKSGFYSNFGIKGTIGAIDCTRIPIVAPPSTAEAPVNLYMNRKGYYSINVEAICDHRLMFTSINARFPGSCHDSGIWTTSTVRSHLASNHDTQRDTWLLGDQGYPLEPWLLTPLAEPPNNKEDKYNKLHGKARNTIERAFGVLKSRFRCLSKQRVLHYTHDKAASIVYASAILHNIIMKTGDGPSYEDEFEEEPNDGEISPSNNTREGEQIRRRYISSL